MAIHALTANNTPDLFTEVIYTTMLKRSKPTHKMCRQLQTLLSVQIRVKTKKLLSSNSWCKNISNYQVPSSSQKPKKKTLSEFPPLPQNTPRQTHGPQIHIPINSISNNITDQLTSFIQEFKSFINPLI